MSWQQKSTWTPLQSDDLGDQRPYFASAQSSQRSSIAKHLHWDQDEGNYEMLDFGDSRSHRSSAPLLSPSVEILGKEPSIRDSVRRDALKKRKGKFTGWKVGVMTCAATAGLVCLLNVGLTIWVILNHRVVNGISFLYSGSCAEVAKISLWIHLAINAMSTLLLSASNYTMQVISSPTRKEIDAAHKNFKWLDIGVPSTRNLRGIPWSRIFMWIILGLSSIPLHLMYNTAVFSSLSTNQYIYVVVTENFLGESAIYNSSTPEFLRILDSMNAKSKNGTLLKLEATACQSEYARTFVSKVRNVLLVTTDTNSTNNVLDWERTSSYDETPYAWICGDGYLVNPYTYNKPVCTAAVAASIVSNWKVKGHPISYCLAEPVVEKCQLRFSLVIMVIVIISNLLKVLVMLSTVWKLDGKPLVTIGDAVSSFLENPDPTTRGVCLSTKTDVTHGIWQNTPKIWTPKKMLWFKAASVKRWLTCNILCCGTIGVCGWLFRLGMNQVGVYDIKRLYELGFGAVSSNSIIGISFPSLLATVLLANLPQGVLSFLYLTYNGLFSCMLGAQEWSRFARHRKPLRVTSPEGKQRSTYYLQLPYTYAIPLLVMSGALHWLMSQSLFLALLTIYDEEGGVSEYISSVGYSCIGIFGGLVVGGIAVLGGIITGFRRYDKGMPLVGSCSAAISAACHRPSDDLSAELLPVQWGVVEDDGSIGHCSFTSFGVYEPLEGRRYAGHDKEE